MVVLEFGCWDERGFMRVEFFADGFLEIGGIGCGMWDGDALRFAICDL